MRAAELRALGHALSGEWHLSRACARGVRRLARRPMMILRARALARMGLTAEIGAVVLRSGVGAGLRAAAKEASARRSKSDGEHVTRVKQDTG